MAERRPDVLPLHAGLFDYSVCQTPTFVGHTGLEHETICAFGHHNPDFSLDPLSANRRFQRNDNGNYLGAHP